MSYPIPVEEVDPFGKPLPPLPVIDHTGHVVETDYRIFRYSKFALPWLVFMLLWFVVIFLLTLWQGGFGNIKFNRGGWPRDLEPWAKSETGEGGLSRKYRNVRFAASILAIVPPVWVLIVYYINPRPRFQRICYYIAVVILVAAIVLNIIAFCLDVTRTRQTVKCKTEISTRTQKCENRSAYLTVCVATEAIDTFLAAICVIMLGLWSRDDTLKRPKPVFDDLGQLVEEAEFTPEIQMKPIIPGQDIVHKTLLALALVALEISAILLLLFTIFIHEFRERVIGSQWDPVTQQQQSGWEVENTRLRLSSSIISMCLVVLSFVPYPKRVYVYVLGFLWLCLIPMYFVVFAMDVKDLEGAKSKVCPPGLTCVYHPYHTTAAFEFMAAIWIIVYLAYEYLLKHKQSTVTVQREIPAAPLEEYMPPYDTHAEYLPIIKPDGTRAIEGPAMRPLLGVEVIEVEHPATGELNVTVMNVTTGGAAHQAGLRVGDIISRWDEIPITSKADFAQAVATTPIGAPVVLQLIRQIPTSAGTTATSIEYAKLTVRGVPA